MQSLGQYLAPSILTAIIVAIIPAYCTAQTQGKQDETNNRIAELKNQVDRSETDIKNGQLALEQGKIDIEEFKRQDELLKLYMPKLLGSNDADRAEALAVLFVLYHNHAKDVLNRVIQSQADSNNSMLMPALEQARSLDQLVGPWRVYISSDRTREAALFNAKFTYDHASIKPVDIYHRKRGDDDLFIMVAGIFPDKSSAEYATIIARSSVRGTANIVDVSGLCPKAARQEDAQVTGDTGTYDVAQYECVAH
jgi:hypothetical protein